MRDLRIKVIDTCYPWARKALRKTLRDLGAAETLQCVVNTHAHEDHTGNNDLLSEFVGENIFAHKESLAEIRFPSEHLWYRHFMFGPRKGVPIQETSDRVHHLIVIEY